MKGILYQRTLNIIYKASLSQLDQMDSQGQGREVHEAFSSYVDSLAENLSKPVTPADTVRRPDSRLPRFRCLGVFRFRQIFMF